MNAKHANLDSKNKPSVVLKLALLQFIGTFFLSLVLYYCFDIREALSAFIGGSIAAVANFLFAMRLLTTRHDMQAEEMLVRFYFSVALKVLFTLAMMAIFIIKFKVSMLPFIIAYLVAAVLINLLYLLVPET